MMSSDQGAVVPEPAEPCDPHEPHDPEPVDLTRPSWVICEITFKITPDDRQAYGREFGIEGEANALADLREHLPEHLAAALAGDYMIRSFTAHSITTRVGRGR
jgi:hypothetical protein